MATGRKNDQIKTNPDIGVNLDGETFENTIEPTEKVQDGLQGQNSTTTNGRNRDQMHHVNIQYQVKEDSLLQRTSRLSNARSEQETMMSQSQFNILLDQVKNEMISSIKE